MFALVIMCLVLQEQLSEGKPSGKHFLVSLGNTEEATSEVKDTEDIHASKQN